jgi:predicted transcriptional regulator of viral defense system
MSYERSDDIERVSRGVYRLTRFPVSPIGQYMEASLWPQVRRPEARGTISYESALALYNLSEVNPSKVHITLPHKMRIRRKPPAHFVIHYAHLDTREIQIVEGIPVTTVERTIRDVHSAHLGSELVQQSVEDARRAGNHGRARADERNPSGVFIHDASRALSPPAATSETRQHLNFPPAWGRCIDSVALTK